MEVEELITEIGTYPETWTIDRVDSVFDLIQGKQVSERNRIGDNQRPFLRTKNVFWNRLELAELDQMHFSAPEEARYALLPGDLLLCEGGDVGRTAMWRGEVERCYIQNHLHRLRAFDGMVDPQYAVFWFWYAFNVGNLYIGRGNKTTIPNMSRSKLAELQIALPPLPEQQRIAQVLSTVQEAIAQQERLIRTTTELKQALMQKLFTEGLRGEALKETEIGRVPESWVKVELGALGRIVTGTTPSTTVKEYYEPAEVDFIAPADIGKSRLVRDAQKKISAAGFAVARPLPKDAVMCVCIGATIGKVGMTAQAQSATNQQINTIICGENYDPRFVHYLLTQHAEYWRSFATFGPVPMLSKGAFEKIIIHVPSNKLDQTDSADALVALDDKIEVAQKKRNALQDLFRTLLHELMTGKVRVNID